MLEQLVLYPKVTASYYLAQSPKDPNVPDFSLSHKVL